MKKKNEADTLLSQSPIHYFDPQVTRNIDRLAVCYVKCRQFSKALKVANSVLFISTNGLLYWVYDEAIKRGYFDAAEEIISRAYFNEAFSIAEDGAYITANQERDYAYAHLCRKLIDFGKFEMARRISGKIGLAPVKNGIVERLPPEDPKAS